MARIVAVDYGTKRCGVAVTDDFQIIASGLTAVPTSEIVSFLKDYCREENVETIVVGLPKQMDNTYSESEVHIQSFLRKIESQIPNVRIDRYDERFTSKMATQTMLHSGINKKQRQNKALIDQISATIILQGYMQSKS